MRWVWGTGRETRGREWCGPRLMFSRSAVYIYFPSNKNTFLMFLPEIEITSQNAHLKWVKKPVNLCSLAIARRLHRKKQTLKSQSRIISPLDCFIHSTKIVSIMVAAMLRSGNRYYLNGAGGEDGARRKEREKTAMFVQKLMAGCYTGCLLAIVSVLMPWLWLHVALSQYLALRQRNLWGFFSPYNVIPWLSFYLFFSFLSSRPFPSSVRLVNFRLEWGTQERVSGKWVVQKRHHESVLLASSRRWFLVNFPNRKFTHAKHHPISPWKRWWVAKHSLPRNYLQWSKLFRVRVGNLRSHRGKAECAFIGCFTTSSFRSDRAIIFSFMQCWRHESPFFCDDEKV